MTTATAADNAAFMLGVRVGGYLFQHMCDEYDFTLAGERWELADDEDLKTLGYTGDTSDLLVLRHVESGACFEVDVEAFARPVPTTEEFARRAEMADISQQLIASWRKKQAS
jgi:hypothetical protein